MSARGIALLGVGGGSLTTATLGLVGAGALAPAPPAPWVGDVCRVSVQGARRRASVERLERLVLATGYVRRALAAGTVREVEVVRERARAEVEAPERQANVTPVVRKVEVIG